MTKEEFTKLTSEYMQAVRDHDNYLQELQGFFQNPVINIKLQNKEQLDKLVSLENRRNKLEEEWKKAIISF